MKLYLKPLMAIATIAGFAGSAFAIPTLTITDGTNTVVVADGSGGDSSSLADVVTFNGAIGNWNINVTTGISDHSPASLDVSSVDHSTKAGTLDIYFSDTSFTTPGFADASIGGTTTNGHVSYWTWANSTLLTSQPNFLPISFSGDATSLVNLSGTYSLTEKIEIVHTKAGTTSFDASVGLPKVPDGGTTALLLGLGLVSVGLIARRQSLVKA